MRSSSRSRQCRLLPALGLLLCCAIPTLAQSPLDDPALQDYRRLDSRQNQQPLRQSQAPAPLSETALDQQGQQAPWVSIIDLESVTLEPNSVNAISQSLWNAAQRQEKGHLLPLSATRNRLSMANLTPSDPYRLPPSRMELARALQSDYLILGNLNKFQGAYAMELQLYSAALDRVIASVHNEAVQSARELLGQLPALVKSLYEKVPEMVTPAFSHPGFQQAYRTREALAPAAGTQDPLAQESLLLQELAALRQENAHLRQQLSQKGGAAPQTASQKKPAQVEEKSQPKALPKLPKPRRDHIPATSMKDSVALHRKSSPPSTAAQKQETPAQHEEMAHAEPESHDAEKEPAHSDVEVTQTAAHEEPETHEAEVAHEEAEAHDEEQAQAEEAMETLSLEPTETDRARAKELYEQSRKLPNTSREGIPPLEKAIQLDPDKVLYQRALVIRLYETGQYSKAAERGEAFVRRGAKDINLNIYTGAAYSQLGKYRKALEAAERVLKMDEKNGYALYNRALNLYQLGDPQAADAFRTFLQVAGNDPSLRASVEQARGFLKKLENRT